MAFGGNVFGWTADEKQSFALLDHFAEAGYNLVDTADVYVNWVPNNPDGISETIIGKWMQEKKNRNQMIIATKVGAPMIRGGEKNLSRDYILSAAEDSLKRLRTDYIDLYQVHYDHLSTTPEESLRAFEQLVTQGKVRWIGASNLSKERLAESFKTSDALALPKYISLQPEYNLYDRGKFENEYAAIVEQENLAVIPYYSLASGFLTGKYRSEADIAKSQRGQKAMEYLNPRGLRILAALDTVAAKYQISPAGIALAWLLTRNHVAAPIASATSTEQLDELLAGTALTLDEESIAILDEASAP